MGEFAGKYDVKRKTNGCTHGIEHDESQILKSRANDDHCSKKTKADCRYSPPTNDLTKKERG